MVPVMSKDSVSYQCLRWQGTFNFKVISDFDAIMTFRLRNKRSKLTYGNWYIFLKKNSLQLWHLFFKTIKHKYMWLTYSKILLCLKKDIFAHGRSKNYSIKLLGTKFIFIGGFFPLKFLVRIQRALIVNYATMTLKVTIGVSMMYRTSCDSSNSLA
jgi:hypothetical protein